MKPDDKAWQQLVATARLAKDERDTAAPFGFATRVAALALSGEAPRPARSLVELFSWRALGLASFLAIASLVANYSVLNTVAEDDVLSDDGAVTTLFASS